jgi:spore coat polysaccharide biosynthesis protein SpsF
MITAVLQARMSSRRLPGKVLRTVIGRPLLALQLERVARSARIDRLIVATSTRDDDDPVAALAQTIGIECFRGSLDDVLDRFYRAARPSDPDYVVRLTGDCPLADPAVIDAAIEFCVSGGYDYAGNALEPTFPDGLDVEVARFACVEQAWREARLPSEREHVLPYLYTRPGQFRIGSFRNGVDLSHLRWTVDEPEDLELVTLLFESLYPANPAFSTADILALIEARPELARINAHHTRNAGSLTSAHLS